MWDSRVARRAVVFGPEEIITKAFELCNEVFITGKYLILCFDVQLLVSHEV